MDQRERSQALADSLRRLGTVAEGVHTCVIIGLDGLAITAFPDGSDAKSVSDRQYAVEVAAVAARLVGMAERCLDRLAQGEIGRLILEGERGTLLICPAGQVTLALIVEPRASLGHVLFAAQKAADEIAAIFEND